MSDNCNLQASTGNCFHRLSQRVIKGKERLNKKKELFSIKEEEFNQGEDFWRQDPVIRRGMAFQAALETIKIPIYEDELIIGDVPYYEFKANTELLPSFLTETEKAISILEAQNKYKRITGKNEVPDYGMYGEVFHTCINYGHIIADYSLPLKIGFGGMLAKIDAHLQELDPNKENEGEKRNFLLSTRICIQAATKYIQRYAEKASEEARSSADEKRREELERISQICLRISTEPPENFYEALQLVWFTQLLMEIESGISAFSFGRMDQYLYPFLKADLETGKITLESAQELVDCFWVKANEQNCVTNDAGRALTIGGKKANSEDGVNELTGLMLRSAGELELLQPKLNARVHPGSPDSYIDLCCKVAARNVGPQFYNDDVIIPSLQNYGYCFEDAVDYGSIGCYEYGLFGKERPSPMGSTFHIGKCLELALHNGVSQTAKSQLGPQTGCFTGFSTYEEFESAFYKQVEFFIRCIADRLILNECVTEATRPLPFLSTLVYGCLEKGKDISSFGAQYSTGGVRFTGFSAVVDSLIAVKTLVFEKQSISKERLLHALEDNFAHDEALRLTLINKAPKYGNDEEQVDAIAVSVGEYCCKEVLKHRHITGQKLKPGLFSFLNFMEAGRNCGAFPNGRKAFEPFVNGISPMHGMDRNGPTAMLSSAAKLNYLLSPDGNALDLKLPIHFFKDERLGQMIRSYFSKGGMQVQLYTLSAEELIDAKRRPEAHGSLIIRVTGYSAYFVTLDEKLQDEIIERTKSFQY